MTALGLQQRRPNALTRVLELKRPRGWQRHPTSVEEPKCVAISKPRPQRSLAFYRGSPSISSSFLLLLEEQSPLPQCPSPSSSSFANWVQEEREEGEGEDWEEAKSVGHPWIRTPFS